MKGTMLPELGVSERAVSDTCKGIGNLFWGCRSWRHSRVSATWSWGHLEKGWLQPSPAMAPCRGSLLFSLLSCLGNPTPGKCVPAFVNVEQWFTYLAKKSRNGSKSGIPRGWRGSSSPCVRCVLLPGECDLLWPQGDAEVVWLSPHSLSRRCTLGVTNTLQEYLRWVSRCWCDTTDNTVAKVIFFF